MSENTIGTNRKFVDEAFLNQAVLSAQKHLAFRLNQKGRGSFASRHEIYGVIAEEVHKLSHAIEANEPLENIQHELRDISVAALFGDACIEARTLDW